MNVEAVNIAMKNLSNEAFKLYIILNLNQDNYIYKGNINIDTLDELKLNGYIKDDVFYELSVNTTVIDERWSKILSLYDGSTTANILYIQDKIEKVNLTDQTEQIIKSWIENYTHIQEKRNTKVKYPIRYDILFFLSRALTPIFEFKTGDIVLEKNIVCSDGNLYYELIKNKIADKITITEYDVNFWNKNYKEGKFTLKYNSFVDILESRIDKSVIN